MRFTLFRPGLTAILKYWKPFLLIQACGLGVVIGYFNSESFRNAMDTLGQWKTAGGVAATAVLSIITGALIPELAKIVALRMTTFDRARLTEIAHGALAFGLLGLIADPFYNALADRFPPDGTVWPPLIKMGIDQFLYSPFFTLPLFALIFTLRRHGWHLRAVWAELGPEWYVRRVVTLLIICWCYWIPMCLLMYSMPKELTFVFAMCAQAAWGLLILFAAANTPDATKPDDAPTLVPVEAKA
jgi:hypothetical protein